MKWKHGEHRGFRRTERINESDQLIGWETAAAQNRPDPSVMCVFRQSCILPCNVDPSSDTVIHWDHITSGHNVHSYYDGQDQLGHQDQQFKGRTSLFHDLLSRGNGSLKLTGLKIQDEGRFSCYSSTERGSKKTFIQLKAEALITEISLKQIENRIICSSEGIYPKPELTWSVYPPSELNVHSPTTIHQTEDQLYNISSSLLVSDSHYDQTFSCTISSGRNRKTVSLPRKRISFLKGKKVMDTSEALGIIIRGFCLWMIFVCIGGIIETWCKTATHPQSNQQNSAESEHLQVSVV